MSALEVLPDSRSRARRGSFLGPWAVRWLPIYCANCGTDGGSVPEENMHFIFYLCPPCFETHGAIAGTYAMPDELFWRQVQDEQIARYGRILAPSELARVATHETSPLATLLREGRRAVSGGG